ncbi:hypothetical protein CYMTET_3207 [Cymbomonas tetramitiformis]|uniref:Uncharacterized protein n=1 Tax=Cymbomonas tetramitiformis TaxID=36881 RepID=A0AAE0LLL5_9CHLO|nr:hypothetical protein CYMTET_3207 [Cymbomonas tetramitiformis]
MYQLAASGKVSQQLTKQRVNQTARELLVELSAAAARNLQVKKLKVKRAGKTLAEEIDVTVAACRKTRVTQAGSLGLQKLRERIALLVKRCTEAGLTKHKLTVVKVELATLKIIRMRLFQLSKVLRKWDNDKELPVYRNRLFWTDRKTAMRLLKERDFKCPIQGAVLCDFYGLEYENACHTDWSAQAADGTAEPVLPPFPEADFEAAMQDGQRASDRRASTPFSAAEKKEYIKKGWAIDGDRTPEDIVNRRFSMRELLRVLNRMKTKKVPRADGVTYEILKFKGWCCSDILLQLLNTAYLIDYWPPSLMEEGLICLLLDGRQNTWGRCRPICLLPPVNNIFTALLNERLQKFNAVAVSTALNEIPCGDPLLLDGNRLTERAAAGRKRVFEVAFDDGDVRWTRLVGKVAFTVTGNHGSSTTAQPFPSAGMDSAVPLARSSQSWPATNGARKLAEALGVDLREVAPRVPRPGAFVDTQDVRRHAQRATCQPEVCAPGAEATTVRTQQPAVKKRRGKAAAPEGPSEAAGWAPAPESSPAEDVCRDPLLLDGNRVRVKWPLEDGMWAEVGGAVRWLAEGAAAGRKRVYEVAFDDGDARRTRLVGKVAFTVTGSGGMQVAKSKAKQKTVVKYMNYATAFRRRWQVLLTSTGAARSSREPADTYEPLTAIYGSAAVVAPETWQHIVVGANGELWRMRQGGVLEDATKAKECLMQCIDSEDLRDGRPVSPYRGTVFRVTGDRRGLNLRTPSQSMTALRRHIPQLAGVFPQLAGV